MVLCGRRRRPPACSPPALQLAAAPRAAPLRGHTGSAPLAAPLGCTCSSAGHTGREFLESPPHPALGPPERRCHFVAKETDSCAQLWPAGRPCETLSDVNLQTASWGQRLPRARGSAGLGSREAMSAASQQPDAEMQVSEQESVSGASRQALVRFANASPRSPPCCARRRPARRPGPGFLRVSPVGRALAGLFVSGSRSSGGSAPPPLQEVAGQASPGGWPASHGVRRWERLW